MSARVLVAYVTRTGTTRSIAEAIRDVLCQCGAAVDVRRATDVDDIDVYDAVVLGGAVRAGRLLPEAVGFVKEHREALEQMPFAAFLVCATLKDDTEENRREAYGYMEPLREVVEPDLEGFFAGAIDVSELSFPMRLILRLTNQEGGDWRDWDAVRAWAGQLPDVLEIDRRDTHRSRDA